MYTYSWLTSLCSRNEHIIKQSYPSGKKRNNSCLLHVLLQLPLVVPSASVLTLPMPSFSTFNSLLSSQSVCLFFFFLLKLNQMMLLFHSQTLQCLPIKYKLLTVYKALGRLASFIFDSLLLMHWAPVILDYLVLVSSFWSLPMNLLSHQL